MAHTNSIGSPFEVHSGAVEINSCGLVQRPLVTAARREGQTGLKSTHSSADVIPVLVGHTGLSSTGTVQHCGYVHESPAGPEYTHGNGISYQHDQPGRPYCVSVRVAITSGSRHRAGIFTRATCTALIWYGTCQWSCLYRPEPIQNRRRRYPSGSSSYCALITI